MMSWKSRRRQQKRPSISESPCIKTMEQQLSNKDQQRDENDITSSSSSSSNAQQSSPSTAAGNVVAITRFTSWWSESMLQNFLCSRMELSGLSEREAAIVDCYIDHSTHTAFVKLSSSNTKEKLLSFDGAIKTDDRQAGAMTIEPWNEIQRNQIEECGVFSSSSSSSQACSSHNNKSMPKAKENKMVKITVRRDRSKCTTALLISNYFNDLMKRNYAIKGDVVRGAKRKEGVLWTVDIVNEAMASKFKKLVKTLSRWSVVAEEEDQQLKPRSTSNSKPKNLKSDNFDKKKKESNNNTPRRCSPSPDSDQKPSGVRIASKALSGSKRKAEDSSKNQSRILQKNSVGNSKTSTSRRVSCSPQQESSVLKRDSPSSKEPPTKRQRLEEGKSHHSLVADEATLSQTKNINDNKQTSCAPATLGSNKRQPPFRECFSPIVINKRKKPCVRNRSLHRNNNTKQDDTPAAGSPSRQEHDVVDGDDTTRDSKNTTCNTNKISVGESDAKVSEWPSNKNNKYEESTSETPSNKNNKYEESTSETGVVQSKGAQGSSKEEKKSQFRVEDCSTAAKSSPVVIVINDDDDDDDDEANELGHEDKSERTSTIMKDQDGDSSPSSSSSLLSPPTALNNKDHVNNGTPSSPSSSETLAKNDNDDGTPNSTSPPSSTTTLNNKDDADDPFIDNTAATTPTVTTTNATVESCLEEIEQLKSKLKHQHKWHESDKRYMRHVYNRKCQEMEYIYRRCHTKLADKYDCYSGLVKQFKIVKDRYQQKKMDLSKTQAKLDAVHSSWGGQSLELTELRKQIQSQTIQSGLQQRQFLELQTQYQSQKTQLELSKHQLDKELKARSNLSKQFADSINLNKDYRKKYEDLVESYAMQTQLLQKECSKSNNDTDV